MGIQQFTIAGPLATGLGNLVLVTPMTTPTYTPLTDTGSTLGPAFAFDIEDENTVSLESDITDHFAEGNISIEDMIALRPEKITVHGFKGELANIFPRYSHSDSSSLKRS